MLPTSVIGTLKGGKGSDLIKSRPGNETIRGGPGRDVADYVDILATSGRAATATASPQI